MKRKKFSEEQIIKALKRIEAGEQAKAVCRELGVHEQIYYIVMCNKSLSVSPRYSVHFEACLDYDKLLPHLYGTRGIDRVCMIVDLKKKSLTKEEIHKMHKRGKLRIMGVAFPEAVRIGESDDIFYAP